MKELNNNYKHEILSNSDRKKNYYKIQKIWNWVYTKTLVNKGCYIYYKIKELEMLILMK